MATYKMNEKKMQSLYKMMTAIERDERLMRLNLARTFASAYDGDSDAIAEIIRLYDMCIHRND